MEVLIQVQNAFAPGPAYGIALTNARRWVRVARCGHVNRKQRMEIRSTANTFSGPKRRVLGAYGIGPKRACSPVPTSLGSGSSMCPMSVPDIP
eukprot:129093-Rhodomonas_salina.1